jgi:hypothetical protein
MLAKLHVKVPFELMLPLGERFNVYTLETDGYKVRFDVPSRSVDSPNTSESEKIEVNGKSAFLADVLTVVFEKESFERAEGTPLDPSEELIQATIQFFLDRLKFVAKAPQVRPIDFPNCTWDLLYLNDDGSELERKEGLFRGRFGRHLSVAVFGCSPQIWDDIFSLAPDFRVPPWHTLLVDSRGALPHVGSAVVLAATALEIFIEEVLHQLAQATSISDLLWKWLNDRGDWRKEPSVEERFDVLLKVTAGHSLKEDNLLWESFKKLRKARNAFVHHGAPILDGQIVSNADALHLIASADAIVKRVREWLPPSLQWPVFQHNMNIQVTKPFLGS